MASRIVIENGRAVGIEFTHGGVKKVVRAKREVLLSGGVINTTQLLMLSGIGHPDELAKFGIEVKSALPGVGKNLQDHVMTPLTFKRKNPGSLLRHMRLDRIVVDLARAYIFGTGFATELPAPISSYLKTSPELPAPDIQVLSYGGPPTAAPYFWPFSKPYQDGFSLLVVLLRPVSRGYLELVSTDPLQPMKIHQNFLTHDDDWRVLAKGIRLIRNISRQKALEPFVAEEIGPIAGKDSDEAISDHIHKTGATVYHPMGTCKMGAADDPMAVGRRRASRSRRCRSARGRCICHARPGRRQHQQCDRHDCGTCVRPHQGIPVTHEAFDYVIVGAGSAGCTLAGRLTEDASVRVLLLEAGGWDNDPWIKIPLGFGQIRKKRLHDWGYFSEPQESVGGRRIECRRGKVIGGSSSINAMGWVRGHPSDFDRWASQGLPGWSYKEVLPYFKKQESWEHGESEYRGGHGPLTIRKSRYPDPLLDAVMQAGVQAGHPTTPDYNGAEQHGMSVVQSNIRNGRRCSAADAYLRPALARKNLTVRTHAIAHRIVIENGRAVGLVYAHKGEIREVRATREVLLSGGVINSPQLLMLSGVGDPVELSAHGIELKSPVPGVGKNFQDHVTAPLTFRRKSPGPVA